MKFTDLDRKFLHGSLYFIMFTSFVRLMVEGSIDYLLGLSLLSITVAYIIERKIDEAN